MRRLFTTMVGAAFLVLAAAFVGCGGDSATAPGTGFLTEATPTDFKLTDTTQFNSMIDQMKSAQKSGGYTQRPTPKSKAEDKAKKE